MLTCKDIDVQLMDWLYGELEPALEASFREHVGSCDACRAEFESLSRIRALFRELPLLSPPQAVSNIVRHEAGKRAQAAPRAGFSTWLSRILQPMVAHPAAAALASLVLIATVGGTLYLRKGTHFAEPVIESNSPERARLAERPAQPPGAIDLAATPTAAPDPSAARGDEVTADERTESLATMTGEELQRKTRGYSADLADEQKQIALRQIAKKSDKLATAPGLEGGDVLYNAISAADSSTDDDYYRQEVEEEGRSGAKNTTESPGGVMGGAPADGADRAATKAPQQFAEPVQPSLDVGVSNAPPPSPEPKGKSKAPAQVSKTQVSKDDKSTWAEAEHGKLLAAIRSDRCQDAARIANDIMERDRAYYNANIGSSMTLESCRAQVVAESNRRAGRTKATKKAKATKKQADEAKSLE